MAEQKKTNEALNVEDALTQSEASVSYTHLCWTNCWRLTRLPPNKNMQKCKPWHAKRKEKTSS